MEFYIHYSIQKNLDFNCQYLFFTVNFFLNTDVECFQLLFSVLSTKVQCIERKQEIQIKGRKKEKKRKEKRKNAFGMKRGTAHFQIALQQTIKQRQRQSLSFFVVSFYGCLSVCILWGLNGDSTFIPKKLNTNTT